MSIIFSRYKSFLFVLLVLLASSFILSCDGLSSNGAGTPVAVDNSNLDDNVKNFNTNSTTGGDVYLIGAGMYDITGPAAEVTMGGFAVEDQKTSGISLRLRSRAFAIGDGSKRIMFISTDTWAMSQQVKIRIAKMVAENPVLSEFYNEKNICISATHTHNSIGGFSGYFLYDIPNKGFIKDNFNAIVNGIYNSIVIAHNNMEPGKILINEGKLDKCGWQRSGFAYENNPEEERALYDGNTDKRMTLLKFVNLDNEEIGTLNWFAVHPDSIGPENHLVSGDNKGHASYMFEKAKGTNYLTSKTFVAAFAQSNAGDITPNVPFTEYLGTIETSMEAAGIDRSTAEAWGFPWKQAFGEADIEKNPVLKLTATRQYEKAKELYDNATEELSGSVDFRHEYVDMRELYVEETSCETCPGGMGASYSWGSPADNPSPYPLFGEGVTTESIDWSEDFGTAFLDNFLSGVIGILWPETTEADYRACHGLKPVILPSGIMSIGTKKIPMTPQIMPVQVFKIGQLAIVAQPTEVTTMAGRRLKKTALEHLSSKGVTYSVVAGLSNAYASYMATKEEYAMQGYEGAGTFFGPNQLLGFQQEFAKLCDAIVDGRDVDPGPDPLDLTDDVVDLTTGVFFDDVPLMKNFGDVNTQPNTTYKVGDVVEVVFWGGHPRNNLMTQQSFCAIERVVDDEVVKVVAYDWDPETKYIWERDGAAYSKIIIKWNTKNAEPGEYRIRHDGHWKSVFSVITPYSGESNTFTLVK